MRCINMYRLSDDEVKELREDFKDAMRVVRDKIKVDVKQPEIMFIQTPNRFEIITLTNSVTEGDIVADL